MHPVNAPLLKSDMAHSTKNNKKSQMPPINRKDTTEIDNTIIYPGSVKINVEGAFIVDEDSTTLEGEHLTVTVNGGSHETKDIRLPNHTAVVSHIAVDVSFPYHFMYSVS